MGFGVDGIFTMTITIMLAGKISVEAAMIWAGLVMSGRRVMEMIVAPLSGHIADRYGVRRTSPDFWAAMDWMLADFRNRRPTEAGLFDLGRYKNF